MGGKKQGYKPKALRVESLVESLKLPDENEMLREFRRRGYRIQDIPFGRDKGKDIHVKAPPPPKSCDTNLEKIVEKDEDLSEEGWEILWYDEKDLKDEEQVKEEIRRKIKE